jgi:predicted pyridoxine 5'-phosphate oxidase superfamily flavin-nucleotide-binding protein
MPKLTAEMKGMIASQQCFIATVSKDCLPNVAPKRSTRVLDDSTLVFTEGTGGATYRNVLDGSPIVVAVVNREIPDGYRFLCRGDFQDSGDVYEQAKAMSLKNQMPAPKGVVLLNIEEIHSLKPGPGAGKKIG